MFVLQLNDMRSSNVEILQPVARAETPEELVELLDRESVEPYRTQEDRWYKVYREGGPLEWFNPPWSLGEHIVDAGTEEDWIAQAIEEYNDTVMCIREARWM